MSKTIIILGAGAGIGQSVARVFGTNGFQVALVGRTADKLTGLVSELAHEGITAKGFAADITDIHSLSAAVQSIRQYGTIQVVHYNAAAVRMVNILEESADTLIEDFKVNVAGLQTAVSQTIGDLTHNKGAVLVTGGGFAMYPYPDFGSLSIGKAAIRNLAGSLNQALATKGVFVGTVTVQGIVSPEAEIHNPENIAKHFWELYTKRTDFEIQL